MIKKITYECGCGKTQILHDDETDFIPPYCNTCKKQTIVKEVKNA